MLSEVPFSAIAPATNCTAAAGQVFIGEGRYEQAIREFECVIETAPTEVEGYRGRIEAEVLLRRYSDAVLTYQRLTAFVLPVHPDAQTIILNGYQSRLAASPNDIKVLTGISFARWWFFDYAQATHVLNQLLAVDPDSPYGNLFRGSSRLSSGASGTQRSKGIADIENGIALDPQNPHVRFIVADAYTYGVPDPQRAFDEAMTALNGGLNTPRIHAILGASYNAFGDLPGAAAHIETSIDLVTTDLVPASPLAPGSSISLDLVPGRVYDIPINVAAGEIISIATNSHDYWDTICVLVDPNGTPVVGSDDVNAYFAAFDHVATATGTYRLKATFFESVITGTMTLTRN